ncbi:MAG: GxxExxY protein [candidate division KSB1 bacterium]|nr:GxxExxY protein [candidate division KSB1 bacterium]
MGDLLMDYNQITGTIIADAIQIHKKPGPGLLESVYQNILAYELKKKGLKVDKEVSISVKWDNITFDIGFRADLIIDDIIIVELKSLEEIKDVHKKQLLTYLKLTNKQVGLLINFNEAVLKDGITRVVNHFVEDS